jgi:cell division septation protein DedD
MTTDARDTRSLPEEGFHEIQLSGKQLVFLFMATTVVSVVIFLCGVLVGRGVRTEAAEGAANAVAAPVDAASSTASGEEGAAATASPEEGTAGTSRGTAAEAGGYYPQLMGDQPPNDVKPVNEAEVSSPPSEPAAGTAAATQAAATPAPREERAAPVEPPPAAGGGYIVQVTALRQRAEAQAIADRLVRKGYQAFVLDPQAGSTQLYRVRVGPYAERAEAERVVTRLAREERFNPWISR